MEPDREQEYHTVSMENHEAILIESLSDFFLKKAYVNVTLVCESQDFMAHQTILAAYSPYFDKLLRQRSERHPVIILNDVSKGDMLTILKFMYQGTVNVPKTKLPWFLRLLKKFQIRGFEHEFLRRNGTESTSSELKERLMENSEVRHQLLLGTLTPYRGKIEVMDSPAGTTIPTRRKSRSESKSQVINPFAKNRRSLDDSDSTFCEEDQAKPGPSKQEVLSPPKRNYDSDIEIIDNNPEVVSVDTLQDIDSTPEWYRKTQPKIKRKLVGSDGNAIGNLPKKRTGKDVIQDSENVEDKEVRVNPVALTNKNGNVKSNSSVATEVDKAAIANRLLKRKKYDKSYSVEDHSFLLKISFRKVRNYCVLCRRFQKDHTTHIKEYHNVTPRRKAAMCRVCSKTFFRKKFLKLHKCES